MDNLIHDTTTLDASQLFKGKLPHKPKHTCEQTGGLIGNVKGVRYIPFNQRVWRDRIHKPNDRETGVKLIKCEACFYERVWRLMMQVVSEVENDPLGDWGYCEISEKQLTNLGQKYRDRNKKFLEKNISIKDPNLISKTKNFKYLKIPQNDHLLLFHNSPELTKSKMIPLSKPRLFSLLGKAVAAMPTQTKVSSSRKFGLSFKGTQGDGRENKYPVRLFVERPFEVRKVLTDYHLKNNNYNVPLLTLIDILKTNRLKFSISAGKTLIDELTLANEINKNARITEILALIDAGVPVDQDNALQTEFTTLTGVVL